MPTIEQTLAELKTRFTLVQGLEEQLRNLRRESFMDEEGYDQLRSDLNRQIRGYYEAMESVLKKFERMPPHHQRHFALLPQFFRDGSYDDSVFIMTKFPVANEPQAQELQNVINLVEQGIHNRLYKPRIALTTFQRWLWDNVELHLLGCSRGVAIVEDKYLPELNPNVAMEWGWMTGMDRQVLFLREQSFTHARADWTGLINRTFDWDNPGPGIEAALSSFLPLKHP